MLGDCVSTIYGSFKENQNLGIWTAKENKHRLYKLLYYQ